MHMKKQKTTAINVIISVLVAVILGTTAGFTAYQMGVFQGEPKMEIHAEYTRENAPVLRVATDYDFCPNSYYNSEQELSGLYVEAVTEAANRLGMYPEFYTDDWLSCRSMLEQGEVDVLCGLEIFFNMEGTLRTIPISNDELCVYGKNQVNSAAALSGKKVALMARSVIISTFDLHCEYKEYYTNTEILEAVERGEADYGICHAAVSEKIMEKNDFQLKKGLTIMKSFPALAVKDSNAELQRQLNRVIHEMAEDGTLYQLKNKWVDDYTKDRSLGYVLKNNQAFYLAMFMMLAMLFFITASFKINNRKREKYIATLLDYQEKLQLLNEEAERAYRVKSEFLSHMSHDIRTPMNGIMGMADIIRKNIGNTKKTEECLDKIDSASGHLLSLINDVLDMSKLESGKVELENIPFSMEDEIRNIHAIVDVQAEEKQIDFSIEDEQLVHRNLVGSPFHFRRILLNLCSNALKYTPENGSIQICMKERTLREDAVMLEVTVTDSGIGMSQEFIRDSLFKPFTQENDSARTKYQGTGLGMSIVYELVKAMEGSIHVDSRIGHGTTFTVTIPFGISKEEIREQSKEVVCQDIQGMKILLAEDNQLNREIAEEILQDAGAVVVSAEDGEQAVEIFQKSEEGSFDAILMDILMPQFNGLEAAAAIRGMTRSDAADIPIIAMTANAFEEDRKKSMEAGMNEHLTKPLDRKKLLELLSRYYKGKRAGEKEPAE